jgi:peptide deformylase
MNARVIQHEYDHLEGILFTDLISPLKKQLIKKRLDKIIKGDISMKYKMVFASK